MFSGFLRSTTRRDHIRKFSSTLAASAPKAAACIIGNEVLTGKVLDTNTNTLAKFLFENGVDLVRVEIIQDEVPIIAESVKKLSDLVGPDGFVFTSGGIGPTHDDVTYEGVAAAFNQTLELHRGTYDKMLEFYASKDSRGSMNEARKRMAMLPAHCEVLELDTWVPFAVVHNVYILPGVPLIFEKMLHAHHNRFRSSGSTLHRALLRTKLMEGDIAETLRVCQIAHPSISIGSYVRLNQGGREANKDESYNVQVSIEGTELEVVEDVVRELLPSLEAYRHEGSAKHD